MCFRIIKSSSAGNPPISPNALATGNEIVSLPLFPTMTGAEQDRVIKSLEKVLKRD